jgi:hypothetical protein
MMFCPSFRQNQRAQACPIHEHQPQMRAHDERELLTHATVAGKSGLERIDDFVVPVANHARTQFSLSAEITEYGRLRNPRPLGDLGARGGVIAFLGEDVASRLKNVLHPLLRLDACRRAAISGDQRGRHGGRVEFV